MKNRTSTEPASGIATETPARNVRNDRDFLLLRNEIEKLANPATIASMNWDRTAALGNALLNRDCQDLLVAVYTAVALLHSRGLPGLQESLQSICSLLASYWEAMYPPPARPRARRNAFAWLVEHILAQAAEAPWHELPPQPPECVASLRAALMEIDSVLAEKCPDAPTMQPLLRLLDGVQTAAPPMPMPTPMPISTATPTAASPAGDSPGIETDQANQADQPPCPDAAATDCPTVLTRLSDIAAAMHIADPSRALAYRLNRIAHWSAIETVPMLRDGVSVIRAPLAPIIAALHRLSVGQADADLMSFAEEQLRQYPFWFDLNYRAVQAMQRAGSQYDAARIAIAADTASLIARLPALRDMQFSDAMPFADANTRRWLQSQSSHHEDGDGHDSLTENPADTAQCVLAEAGVLARNGDLAGAAACVHQLIAATPAASGKLVLRIAVCALLFAQRPAANLLPFARTIVDDIDSHRLDTWDPALALSGLLAAYPILARGTDRADAAALLDRIVILDAGAAVELAL